MCAWWGASGGRCGAGDRPPLIDLDVPESWWSAGLEVVVGTAKERRESRELVRGPFISQ